ncbi:hypothetical protein [Chelativorans sp. J32]|uniref:hypothetical protein n=1 Tax=Chelativorans sp. J32 TaxID=935840 RepID=UPI0004814D8E|nr:hypothetical protein [Chelativorans sp. J32]
MNLLLSLMEAHIAALTAYDSLSDAEWKEQGIDLGETVNATRDALLDHRAATLEEIRTKAEFMAKTRTFFEWDDFDRIKLIHALTPVIGGAS